MIRQELETAGWVVQVGYSLGVLFDSPMEVLGVSVAYRLQPDADPKSASCVAHFTCRQLRDAHNRRRARDMLAWHITNGTHCLKFSVSPLYPLEVCHKTENMAAELRRWEAEVTPGNGNLRFSLDGIVCSLQSHNEQTTLTALESALAQRAVQMPEEVTWRVFRWAQTRA